MEEMVLQAKNISKSFGITRAVRNVSLDFKKGEIRGLIGENGSGKSTFVSMLAGILPIDKGSFILEDEELKIKNQVEANRKGISIIVQEMGTLPGITVADNIFLGSENQFIKFGIKKTSSMNRAAAKLLEQYGFGHISASTMIDHYNFEDRKLIEIVKATHFNPKILIIDETTTALSQYGREELYKHMERFKNNGRTVIFISHDLTEVLEHTDYISVLRDGELIDTVESNNVNEDDLKRLMVGRELKSRYYRTDFGGNISGEVVMSVENLTVPEEIDEINFELHKGEILGFGGLSECGMHEVGKAIFGASFDRSGTVKLENGKTVNSVPDAIKNSIAYASKDRDNESLVCNSSIRDNICLPSIGDLSQNGILSSKKMNEHALKHAQLVSVKMTGIDQFVSDLSGGNKQKVVLARWLGKDSDILVLDSPTRGIDVKVKADIYEMMSDLKRKGKSIIMISEEIQELIGMCDRVIIMKSGKISGEFLRDEQLGEEDLIKKMV
ncbi:MAG: Ribose import ATP-binding protein RbsA [Firmicutes bacterium ADurb.Bin182]|nr:MAG: Ribose import ATP-binding protein RbsA [Firmicutes bacterium ADurb.Bin182]